MTYIRYAVNDAIATITLDRSEKRNALFGTMREDLLAALRRAEGDPAVRVVVITGAGQTFCAGGDIDVMIELKQRGDVAEMRRLLEKGKEIVLFLGSMTKPVIASIDGAAAGAGLNLALACDLRIASDQARLGETFVKIGLHPDWGGSFTLPALVGPACAAEMMFTGEMIDARKALQIGLVSRVVPRERLEEETRVLALLFAKGPPLSLSLVKRTLCAATREVLAKALDREIQAQAELFVSHDFSEGLAAFREKRDPQFRGD